MFPSILQQHPPANMRSPSKTSGCSFSGEAPSVAQFSHFLDLLKWCFVKLKNQADDGTLTESANPPPCRICKGTLMERWFGEVSTADVYLEASFLDRMDCPERGGPPSGRPVVGRYSSIWILTPTLSSLGNVVISIIFASVTDPKSMWGAIS